MQENTKPSLRMLLAGSMLTEAEAKRWRNVFLGKRKFLPILGFVFAAFLMLGMVPTIFEQQITKIETITAFALLAVCSVAALVFFIKILRYPQKLYHRQWQLYVADAKYRSSRRIEVYNDGVIEKTARNTKIVLFNEVKIAIETADGFAVSDGYACIVLRAADMTAFDVAAFRLLLEENVGAEYRYQKETACPRMTVPLPIPKEESLVSPDWISGINKPYCETALYREVNKKKYGLLVGFGLPVMVLVALITSALAYEPIFSEFFAVQLSITVIVFLLFVWFLLMASYNKYSENIKFVFAEDGILLLFSGTMQFCPKEDITFKKVKKGVAVYFEKMPLLVLSDVSWQTFMNLDKKNESDSTNE